MLTAFRGQGVTRIRTRRQNARIFGRFLLFLLGLAACLYVGAGLAALVTGPGWRHPLVHPRPVFTGTGPLLNVTGKHPSTRHLQFPAVLVLPVPWLATLAGAAPLLAVWLFIARTGVFRRRRHVGPERHRGLASVKDIRELFGRRAVRAAGAFTMPGSSRWSRMWLPMTSFGYHVGAPLEPRVKGMDLWFNFETRLRIIARSGWGKSWRLLIPIIRNLPGAAVVTSVEAEIFTATVKARMWRRPPVRFGCMRLLRRRWRTERRFPVYVADLSAPESRFAAGFPLVRWNPIVGSENFKMATARARALVSGGDADSGQDSGTDKFFRDSATQVLAAWLQAAAMDPTKDIEDLVAWLRTTDLATPESILQNAATQEAGTAVMNMITHLDPAAGRTTSGVKRYLNFAIASLASGQGRALCGPRNGPQFDMGQLILDGGTVYLLAEPEEMELARPILTLVAQEMFLAAERIARRLPGRRHRQTFMGVFDELFAGVRMPLLPYVASVQRKYGISYAYAIQSSSDEDELFGKSGAQRLRNQSVTIMGGYDSDSAQETARRAGRTGVVTRSRHQGGGGSEHTQLEDVLPESDQQKLKNGQSIIIGLGIAPFLAMTQRIDHRRPVRAAISQQMREVETYVARRRDRELIDTAARDLFDRDPATVLDHLMKEHTPMTAVTDTQQTGAITVDQVRALAARLDGRAPGTPPWAWPNLDPADAALVDSCLDEFVKTYNRIHAAKVEEVIPRCWRLHPPLAQELPVQFWAWWTSHIDPKASINNALDYYNRNLPAFQSRLETRLLGKGAANCRKGQHRNLVDPELTAAISHDTLGPAEQTGTSADTRRALHQIDFGSHQRQTLIMLAET